MWYSLEIQWSQDKLLDVVDDYNELLTSTHVVDKAYSSGNVYLLYRS